MIEDVQGVVPRTNSAEETFMPFSCNVLSKALIDYARTHLNETEETRRKGLDEVREFLKTELKLGMEVSDIALLCFLRSRKFDVKKTCGLLRRAVEFVDSQRHLFDRLGTDSVRRTVQSKAVGFLPYRDAKGRAILFIQTQCWKPEELKVEDLLFGCIASMHIATENPVNQVAGGVVIFDFKNFGMQHVVGMGSWIVFGLQALQRCCPCLVKELHVIHTPKLFRTCYKAVKPFLSEKIKKRVIFYKSSHWDSLHSRISPTILPEELGGQLGPYSYEHWAGDIADIEKKYHTRYSRFLNRQKVD